MPTNIDTGLTVADAVNADHSPHIFTMSNGDLVAIYYDGTNFVWRSKSGGTWSAKTTITLDTGVTPPQVSYLTRNGDVIFAVVSKDPIDATHNADFFQLTYTPATHTLATTNKQVDAADGSEKAAGIGYTSGASANNQLQVLHGNAAGSFATVQQLNVNPTIYGTDQVPTMMDYRTSALTGLVTDGTTTTYLIYAIASTGTAFKVERFVTSSATDNVESPPAPAFKLIGVCADAVEPTAPVNKTNMAIRAAFPVLMPIPFSKMTYRIGSTKSVKKVAMSKPPITTVANGRCTSAPAPLLMAIGKKPSEATKAVISTGRSLTLVPINTIRFRSVSLFFLS